MTADEGDSVVSEPAGEGADFQLDDLRRRVSSLSRELDDLRRRIAMLERQRDSGASLARLLLWVIYLMIPLGGVAFFAYYAIFGL